MPPDPDLRMDAVSCVTCGDHEISNQHGQCVECDEHEFVDGNDCEECPSGYVLVAETTCVACERNEFVEDNECVPCPGLQIADRNTNACVDCSLDVVLDAATFTAAECGISVSDIANFSPPGDTCPGEFWLELRNAEHLYTTFASDFQVLTQAFSDLEQLQCEDSAILMTKHRVTTTTTQTFGGTQDWPADGAVCVGGAATGCQEICQYPTQETVTRDVSESLGILSIRYRYTVPGNSPPVNLLAWATNVCAGPD